TGLPREQSKVESRKSRARTRRSAAFSTFNFRLFNFRCICNKVNDLLTDGGGRGGVEEENGKERDRSGGRAATSGEGVADQYGSRHGACIAPHDGNVHSRPT